MAGVDAAGLLMLTHYLCAVAIAGVLPLFLLLERYRRKSQYLFIGAVYLAFLIAGLYVLLTANPYKASVIHDGEIVGQQFLE